jgi:adenylosuccinate synthase
MVGASPSASTPVSSAGGRKHGIDVVLGAQWGDEGKGKLVDLLSQVCCCFVLLLLLGFFF